MKKLIIITILLISINAWGATYYMRADGTASSGNPPTAPGPCGTVGNTLSIANHDASTFSAGDTIVLCDDGGIYRDQMDFPSSGSSGNVITYEAASGDTPIISAADILSNWTSQTIGFSSGTIVADIEEGDLSDWDATSIGGGDLTASTNGLMGSTDYGMQAVVQLADQTALYGQADFTWSGRDLRIRLYFDPNGFSRGVGASDYIGIVSFEATNSDRLAIEYIIDANGSGHHIRFAYLTDAAWVYGDLHEITDAPHYIEVYFQRASNDVAADGTCQIWIDGDLKETDSNIDLYDQTRPDNVKVGIGVGQFGLDVESSGTIFSDEMVLNQTSATIGATSTFTAYYDGALGSDPNQVFEDDARLAEQTTNGALTAGDWWWDSGNTRVYVRTTGDDDPSGYTVEASARAMAIEVGDEGANARNYITIDGLTLKKGRSWTVVQRGSSTNLTVQNCTMTQGFDANIKIRNGANTATITGNTVTYAAGSGIHLLETQDVTVSKNTVNNNAQVEGSGDLDWSTGIKVYGTTTTGIIVEENEVFLNGKNAGGSAVVSGNRGGGIHFDNTGTGDDGRIVRYNEVYDNLDFGIMIELSSYYAEVYGNVVYTNDEEGLRFYNKIKESKVYNNAVYGNGSEGIELVGDGTNNSIENNIFKNNISVDNTAENLRAAFGGENDGTNGSGNVYTYNCFDAEAANFIEWGNGVNYSTYNAWQAAGGCGAGVCDNQVEADPLFTSVGSDDFTLQPTSPAIDTGTDLGASYDDALHPHPIASWPDNVWANDQDLFGSWEIGAYFYYSRPIISN